MKEDWSESLNGKLPSNNHLSEAAHIDAADAAFLTTLAIELAIDKLARKTKLIATEVVEKETERVGLVV